LLLAAHNNLQDIGWAGFPVTGLCEFRECQTRHDDELSMLSRMAVRYGICAQNPSPAMNAAVQTADSSSHRENKREIVLLSDFGDSARRPAENAKERGWEA
jgi:hypothetical protein